MEPTLVDGYDISAVVNVGGRRLIETMERLVRKPNRELLVTLTAMKPSNLNFFIQRDPNTTDDGCDSVKLLLVGPSNKVIYIGWALNRVATLGNWEGDLEREENSELQAKMIEQGPFTLWRDDDYDYIVPMDALILTTDVCEEALRKCLQTRSPSLANLPISWLSEEVASKLTKAIEEHPGEPEDPPYDVLFEKIDY